MPHLEGAMGLYLYLDRTPLSNGWLRPEFVESLDSD